MKKHMRLVVLLLAVSLLACACSQRPPAALVADTPEGAQQIAAEPESGSESKFFATLYFRYGDTALLRQEMREISLSPNETREKALVSALLEGSREPGSRALFPEKTQVLSTQAQDGIIYITLNEALYDRYSDESKTDAVLRRELALAALTATLTENSDCHSVQVLVRAEENVGRSMRLSQSFVGGAEDALMPPLTRQNNALPTPAAYARALLTAWQTRDWNSLAVFVAAYGTQGLGGDANAFLNASPALVDFIVYEGTVSPDGGSAVVCADWTLRDQNGRESCVSGYPLRLTREGGAWKITAAQLRDMMGENNE